MDSIAALVEAVRKRAETLPPGTWIRGRGYDHTRLVEGRHPNRTDFDPVAPAHPVVFTRTCGHILAWNTKARELAGLSEEAPDPDGGRYDRDPDGRLLGGSYESGERADPGGGPAIEGAAAPLARRREPRLPRCRRH